VLLLQFLVNACGSAAVPLTLGAENAKESRRVAFRVLTIENYPKTTLGLIATALSEVGAECRILRTHAGDTVPSEPDGFDALILLGGAQDALDDANHPYLRDEVNLVRAFGDADKPVLGSCLGAQIIARAYGAENVLDRPIEFGWHEVRATEAGRADPVLSVLNERAPLFHWHRDTFTLPPGAVHLAESNQTPIQAFRFGRAVYGLQFHFEAGTDLVDSWTRDFADEIAPYAPDWFEHHTEEATRQGAAADVAGLAIARAWVALVGASAIP
jgi:GMP synthase-like glutamine amidotransferase